MFLQECAFNSRDSRGSLHAFRAEVRPLGYVVHPQGNLLVVAARGLNVTPIKGNPGDDGCNALPSYWVHHVFRYVTVMRQQTVPLPVVACALTLLQSRVAIFT